MGFAKQAATFLEKNFRYAKAVTRTSAGASFMRWGAIGAGMGAVYGMADNLTGNDRTSVMQGAVRGAMLGMGARGLFRGFKGLGVRGSTLGRGASMYGGIKKSSSTLALPAPWWQGAGYSGSGNGFVYGGANAATAMRGRAPLGLPNIASVMPKSTTMTPYAGRRARPNWGPATNMRKGWFGTWKV